MEELVEGVKAHWNIVNDGTPPKRDVLVQALTGLVASSKRHTQNGGLKKVRKKLWI